VAFIHTNYYPTMKTRLYFKILLLCVIAILPLSMQALSASHFAASSKLASGKWAKVSIHETGVHEITAAQLAEMRREGAWTLGQDEESSIVYGMPKVAYEYGGVQRQVSLSDMADAISKLARDNR
jgi:hypothetical protein